MEKLTAEQILKRIEENGISVRNFAWNNVYWEELNLGKVIEVDQYGGEDQWSTWYSIKHFVDHDVYIKTNGYCQSHHGTHFHDGYGHEVKPAQKTITVFE